MTQPEALRLADLLGRRGYVTLTLGTRLVDREIAAELRRLYAENEKKSEAIQRLWKERDTLRAQRDELLEALQLIADVGDRAATEISRAAIAKVEGKT